MCFPAQEPVAQIARQSLCLAASQSFCTPPIELNVTKFIKLDDSAFFNVQPIICQLLKEGAEVFARLCFTILLHTSAHSKCA
jgi:hypothetical protein